jgi:hypothetical protein
MESAWRSERRPNSTFHGGIAPTGGDGYDFMAACLATGASSRVRWLAYEIGWRNDGDRAVLIYCEGDIGIELVDSLDAYFALLERTTRKMAASDDDAANLLDLLRAYRFAPSR